MAGWTLAPAYGLFDANGALVGFQGLDRKEYLIATSAPFAALQPFTGALTDGSGTPGSATINTSRGRCAFAGGASAVTVTNSLVTAASQILVVLETTDGTLTFIKSVVPGAGSFVVTGNANATGTTKFSFVVHN